MAPTLRAEGTVLSPLAQIPQAPDPSVITSLVFSFSLDNSLSDAVSSLGLREHGLHETDSVLPHTMIPDADKQTLVDQHATVVRAHAPRSGWVGGSPDPSVALLLAASSGLVFFNFSLRCGSGSRRSVPPFFPVPRRSHVFLLCYVAAPRPVLLCYVCSVLRGVASACVCGSVPVCECVFVDSPRCRWAELG